MRYSRLTTVHVSDWINAQLNLDKYCKTHVRDRENFWGVASRRGMIIIDAFLSVHIPFLLPVSMPVSSNDVQRLFLQAIMSRKFVSQKLAAKIWEKCIDAVRGARLSDHLTRAGRLTLGYLFSYE